MGASFETVITSPPGWGMVAVAENGNLVIFNDAWDYPNYSTDGGYTWQSGTGTTQWNEFISGHCQMAPYSPVFSMESCIRKITGSHIKMSRSTTAEQD